MHVKAILTASVASAALMSGASAAVAGGFVAPSVEVAPVVAAPVVLGNWAGAYAGGSLGYSFGGDDEIGFDVTEGDDFERATGLGSIDIRDATGGVHLGYRWQRGQWVFGPELGYKGGSVDAAETIAFDGDTFAVESEVNSLITLVLKTGYAINPQTLVYGTFGAVRSDFVYTLRDDEGMITHGYNKTGVAAGLGVEQMISARTPVFAEYQCRHFGRTDISYGDGDISAATVAIPDHSNIRLGANFLF